MNTFSSENLSSAEASRRYLLSALVFAFFFANIGLPAWISFVAIYPFATAILKWDPINATIELLTNKFARKIGPSGKWLGAY